MPPVAKVTRIFRGLVESISGIVHRNAWNARMNDEMQFHIDQLIRHNLQRGLSSDDARRTALIAFGGRQRHAESARDEFRSRAVDELARDVRYAVRSLGRAPAFTAAVVLCLAIGIGATSAIVTVVERVVLRPLPYGPGGQLVMLWSRPTSAPDERDVVSYLDYLDWVHGTPAIERAAAFNVWSPALTGTGDPEVLHGSSVNADFFRVLGVAPILGRTFRADEDVHDGARVVVIGHGLWQQRFGGDRHIIGRKITLSGYPYDVIGVMPAAFRSPEPFVREDAEVWRPLSLAGSPFSRDTHYLRVIARLRPGVSVGIAQRDLDVVAARLARAYPITDSAKTVAVTPMEEQVVGAVGPVLFATLAGAACLLLIVCGNVATLVVARHENRAGEIAVRIAMGAGRARLARMLFMESALLSVVGGTMGLLLASGALAILRHAAPADLPRVNEIVLDVPVVMVTIVITFMCSVLFGVFPSRRATRVDLSSALHAVGRRATARGRMRSTIIVAQFALSLLLLSAAGLLVRTLMRLNTTPLGFSADHLLTMQVALPGTRYGSDTTVRAFYRTVTGRLDAIPGVVRTGITSSLPLSGLNDIEALVPVTAGAVGDARAWSSVHYRGVTPDYRSAMGIRLIAGRDFTEADTEGAPPVVILNRAAAEKFYPRRSPLGAEFVTDTGIGGRAHVVGVVEDIRFAGPIQPTAPEMFVPEAQFAWGEFSIVVRTAAAPGNVTSAVRDVVRTIDPDLPLRAVQPMTALVAGFAARQRFYAILLSSFAAMALILSAIGVYGLVSYLVAARRREIGLRIALGAQPGTALRRFVLGIAKLTALGLVIGVLGSMLALRAIASLLYGVQPFDAATMAVAIAVLMATALGAAFVPAFRATRISPAIAMRDE